MILYLEKKLLFSDICFLVGIFSYYFWTSSTVLLDGNSPEVCGDWVMLGHIDHLTYGNDFNSGFFLLAYVFRTLWPKGFNLLLTIHNSEDGRTSILYWPVLTWHSLSLCMHRSLWAHGCTIWSSFLSL